MKSNRGFSLLELLLYLGIFAIVGGSLFGILTSVVRVSTREVSGDEVASQLQFAMTTINRLVRESSNIEIATSTATTTLKLRMPIAAQDPTCISLVNGVLKLSQGPAAAQPSVDAVKCTAVTTDITTNKVVVDTAWFKRVEFPGGHDQVLVDMQFSNTATGANKISRALRSGISRASAATFDSDLLPNADQAYEIGFAAPQYKRWKNISVSNLLNLGAIDSDPAGIDGSIYYNSTSKTFRGRANGTWNDIGSSLWKATSTNAMYSNVSGNIGIGTQAPTQKLSVYRDIGTQVSISSSGGAAQLMGWNGGSFYVQTGTQYDTTNGWRRTNGQGVGLQGYSYFGNDGSVQFGDVSTTLSGDTITGWRNPTFVLNAAGNLGIGTQSPTAKLHVSGGDYNTSIRVAGTIGAGPGIFLDANNRDWAIIGTNPGAGAGDQKFGIFDQTGGAYRMIIDNAGNVGIGVTNPTYKLEVNGDSANTTGVWAVSSDVRLKNNIAPISGALKTVTALQGVGFNWRDEAKNKKYGRVMGFIAQDIERVLPQWTKMGEDGYKRIETIGMDALLVEAIKEQQQQIESLKAEVAELKIK